MGSTCIKIPITANDIEFNEDSIQELQQVITQTQGQEKIKDQSVFSDDEIQLTSHSFEVIQVDSQESKRSKINQNDQITKIKSILKTPTQCKMVQTSTTQKQVTFCFISPSQYKQMITCQSNISPAQKEFLETLYASQ